jgi:hypothetical protein
MARFNVTQPHTVEDVLEADAIGRRLATEELSK